MNQGKHGLRAFGLAIVAVLGLMALMAAGAQANWLILLKENDPTSIDTPTSNVLVKVVKHTADMTDLITGVNLSILCKKIEGDDVLLIPGTATTATASGTLLFSECEGIEKSTGKTAANCKPAEPIQAAGKMLTVLHTNGRNYLLFEPESGKPFTTIKFSELCALTETSNITGELVFECGLLNGSGVFVGEDCKNHQKVHLMQQAPEALFPGQLKYGTHVSTVDGIVADELVGAPFTGLSWSGEA